MIVPQIVNTRSNARPGAGQTSRGQDDSAEILLAMQQIMEVQHAYNRLMQERMDRQKVVGQFAVRAPPPPPLPRPETVTDFRRLNLGTFAGTETPLQAEQWLVKTEQFLRAARISEADKTDVVSI